MMLTTAVLPQGDPGIPGFKGEAGPKGERVSKTDIKYLHSCGTKGSKVMLLQPHK